MQAKPGGNAGVNHIPAQCLCRAAGALSRPAFSAIGAGLPARETGAANDAGSHRWRISLVLAS